MFCEIWGLKYKICVVCIVLTSKMASCSAPLERDVTLENNLELTNKTIPSSQKPVVESDIQQTNMIWQYIHDNKKLLVPSQKTATELRWLQNMWLVFRTSKIKNQPKSLPFMKGLFETHDKASSVRSKSSKTNFNKDKQYSTIHTKNKISKETNSSYHKTHRKKRDAPVVEKEGKVNAMSSITGSGASDSALSPTLSLVSRSVRSNKTSVSLSGHEDTYVTYFPRPVEWTAEGNYSAVRKLINKFNIQQRIARDAQIAFMCMVFLLCLLSLCVWCTGMCYRKKIHYMKWSFQDSHALTSVRDIFRRRWNYLPEQSFYEEVFVHDRGTDP
ncbi:uncharacterized protein [Haliotis cracherodii]|uniref:uncharacterized protein n=1 Tax=Haliotis cracherodii TaxID=6455 RepID=UPI0039E9CA4B